MVSVSVSGCGYLDGGVANGAKQCLCVPASPFTISFPSSLCCRFPWPSAHQPWTTTSPLHLYSHWETPPPYTQSPLSSLPNLPNPITPPSNNPPIRHHPHHSPQPGNLNDLLVPTQQHAHGLPAAFAAASGVDLREPGSLGG